ncbi:MAG: NAD(P)-dependent oxidoreductase [Bryobacteraceae bacterium]
MSENGIGTVGVVGLGLMGGEFARHLAAAGVRTLGFDVRAEQLEAARAVGVIPGKSAAAVAAEADFVLTSLPSVKALEAAFFGPQGIADSKHDGLIVAETSTFPLEAKESARVRLGAVGIRMIDSPISGTGSQAKNKDITIFLSGDAEDCAAAAPVVTHFTRSVLNIGAFGAGSKLKYIANLLIAVHNFAAAEAVTLAEKAGLDPIQAVEWLRGSAATSRMLDVRGPIMATGDFQTPMMKTDVFQKDLEIIGDFARKVGCPTPLFAASVPFFMAANSMGMGSYDVASVVDILRQMAGLRSK